MYNVSVNNLHNTKETIVMKLRFTTFTAILLVVLTIAALTFSSCAAKTVTVRVLDGEGAVICEETVEVGADNPNSIQGVNFYALDCLEAALTQAGIEYYVNKEDSEAFVVTNIGDIATDKNNQFAYYRKDNAKSEFVDKTGLTAQHDEMEGGEILEFRYQAIAASTETK